MMRGTLVIFLSIFCLNNCFASYTKQYIRSTFEQDFHDRCDKYPFVQEYVHKLENPPDRYVVFTYHERGLRNGGIGDRFGGLVSAVAMSLKFNRTLLIRATNGFHESFRPYHPTDIKAENPKYLWNKWSNWTSYKAVNERLIDLEDDDDEREKIEYDMSDCVSNMEEGFSPEHTYHCSMNDGDVPQQVIKFKSNRAYLCSWVNHPEYKAHEEIRRVLYGANYTKPDTSMTVSNNKNKKPTTSPLGFDPMTDLFEVAGCMLRLAIWPTEALWDNVDKLYAEYHKTLAEQYDTSALTNDSGRKLTKKSKTSSKKSKTSSKKTKTKKSKKSKKSDIAKKTAKKRQLGTDHGNIDDDDNDEDNIKSTEFTTTDNESLSNTESNALETTTTTAPTQNSSTTILQQPIYQIGLHMRCGDKYSYFNLKLHTDGYDRYACIVEEPDEYGVETTKKHEKSTYLNAGNPITIGTCGRSVYTEYVESEAKAHRKRVREAKQQQQQKQIGDIDVSVDGTAAVATQSTLLTTVPLLRDPLRSSFAYVTTDNILAGKQINTTMGHPHTFISPQGCHIELDPSTECHMFTVSYWFMLSLSDVLVTQTFGEYNAPTSSFSRYAGLYGLKVNPFRSGRYCHERFGNAIISYVEQGNWFCR